MKAITLNNGRTAYEFEDIAFVNTSLFSEAAQHFTKYGCYTKAPSGSLEHKQFWDIEEDRLANGMSAPGKLYTDSNGIQRIQDVHITGEHYGYLNYGRIKRTKDTEDLLLGHGNENVFKTRKLTAKKEVSFPDFWDGDYHYFSAVRLARLLGKHILVFKARRKGYSYKNGYLCAHITTHVRNSTSIIGAFDKKFLIQGTGTTVMAKNYLDWYQLHTDFNRGYLSIDIENIELGYKNEKENIPRGYRSKLLTVSFGDNPDAVIGKDGDLILFEEAGKFPNLREALDVTLSSTEDGEVQTGQIIVFGTGGSKEANWAIFEKLFYNPDNDDFMPFHNVWDTGRKGSACGFFHGHLMNLIPHVDEHGNSLINEARESVQRTRDKKRETTNTESEYTKYIGQRCIEPAEGFSSTGVSIFTSETLTKHTEKVTHDAAYKGMSVPGVVKRIEDKAIFIPNLSLPPSERHDPILKYQDSKQIDWNGCVMQNYPPFKVKDEVPEDLYRIWHDPYAFVKEQGKIHYRDSMGTAYVYEKVNNFTPTKGDILVANYVGRPNNPDDYNEMLLALCLYYNAKLVFERDRGDVERYFKRAGHYDMLAYEPTFSYNKALQSKRKIRMKGILISEGSERKREGALLLRKWLNVVRTKGIEDSDITKNLEYIYDLGLLEELKYWDLKGNFDRVSALIVGMLDREEQYSVEPTIVNAQRQQQDDFFNRPLF